MTVKIEIKQEQDILSDGRYRVSIKVIYTENISSAIFVFNTETQEFSNVAFPCDIWLYPIGIDNGVNEGASFYRLDTVVSFFDDVSVALNFAAYTRSRIYWLSEQYTESINSFVGSTEYTFEG